jgi:glycogen phosphorylase
MKSNFYDFSKTKIAYFSMEIGINPEISTYSGGLGVLAGDLLRSAADLNVPITGLTLLYKEGYLKQKIDSDGNQIEESEFWAPEKILKKLPNKISVTIRGREVVVGCWIYELRGIKGNTIPILFLDTDNPENSDSDKKITSHLYGGDDEYRLVQEIVLGIGGVRMLENLGCQIDKYHMNEGHSGLLALEVYKKFSRNKIENVRNKCVFTTHTPVPAGHDQFDRRLVEDVLLGDIPNEVREEIFLNGKLNMTYLGLRFSGHINGVAKKHEEVSKKMFPGYHIESITNGVHSHFWTSHPFRELFDKYIPNWKEDSFNLRYIMSVPKEKIWKAHMKSKEEMISFVNKEYNQKFNPKIFTIGFARRATGYKRANLIFSDTKKLVSIAQKFNGLQIIFSGKAHPRDTEGKEIIKNIIQKSGELKDKIKIFYIPDYNIKIAKLLVSGVDLWLNTPLRPKEASGTSGMKAAHNGIPHFSVLDGWWLEGHIENVTGWSIGCHPDSSIENKPEDDIEDLYAKLEYLILPTYYGSRDKWTEIMRHTIAINASFFNTHRVIEQYVLNSYFK